MSGGSATWFLAELQEVQPDAFHGCDFYWGQFSDGPEQSVPSGQSDDLSGVLGPPGSQRRVHDSEALPPSIGTYGSSCIHSSVGKTASSSLLAVSSVSLGSEITGIRGGGSCVEGDQDRVVLVDSSFLPVERGGPSAGSSLGVNYRCQCSGVLLWVSILCK